MRQGPSPYTEAQRAAWMPAPRKGAEWSARLAAQCVIVAEGPDGIEGFMSLRRDGYVDFAYIRPECQGRGLFRRLFDALRQQAERDGHRLLWVHASLRAQPAFSALGFDLRQKERVAMGQEVLERYEMAMTLDAGRPLASREEDPV